MRWVGIEAEEFVIGHNRRKMVRMALTEHPSAASFASREDQVGIRASRGFAAEP